jgi:RNA polymerase sigma-70 factor, ECF subfamily
MAQVIFGYRSVTPAVGIIGGFVNDFTLTRPVDATNLKAGAEEDARLLQAATSRDARAFASLMARHYAIVYRVIWRVMNGHADAEDVTQEAFMRLWNNPSQLRDANALRAWLIRVATNLANDRHRGQPMAGQEAMDDVADESDSAAQALMRTEAKNRIDRAIEKLPERQRLALTLVHLENLGQRTAAEIMELSVEALESLVARARRALKEDLASDWQDLRGLLE